MRPILGREFYRDVLKHLGFPKNAIRGTITIEPGEVVTVACEIVLMVDNKPLVEDGEIKTALKKYELVEKEDAECL